VLTQPFSSYAKTKPDMNIFEGIVSKEIQEILMGINMDQEKPQK